MSRLRPLVLLLLLSLLPSTQAAQDLTDQWFKLKVVAKGVIVDANDGMLTPSSAKTTVYIRLVYEDPVYHCSLYWESSPGDWGLYNVTSLVVEGTDKSIAPLAQLPIPLPTGTLTNFVTLQFKLKKDKAGEVKSATVKSVGGVLGNASLDGVNAFEGGITITGKTIPQAKLPFEP